MELLQKVEDDAEGSAAARYLTAEERLNKISALGKDRQKWRMDAVRDALQTVPDEHQTEVSHPPPPPKEEAYTPPSPPPTGDLHPTIPSPKR